MNNYAELEIPDHAIEYLSKTLYDGTLVLFLGAGVSKDLKLPDWSMLISSLLDKKGLPPLEPNPSVDQLQSAADRVLKKCKNEEEFIDLIHDILYKNPDTFSKETLFTSPLLLSILSLLIGSKRGHVKRVITLNYDNILEWYLSVFGFSVKTIFELPAVEGSEDVRIYHPNGFIPYSKLDLKRSNFVLLGKSAANVRLGTIGDPWFELTRHLLSTGVCLFIGLSTNSLTDRSLAPLLETIGRLTSNKRPLGLWLLTKHPDEDTKSSFASSNIVPVVFNEFKEIHDFLFKISEKAALRLGNI